MAHICLEADSQLVDLHGLWTGKKIFFVPPAASTGVSQCTSPFPHPTCEPVAKGSQ